MPIAPVRTHSLRRLRSALVVVLALLFPLFFIGGPDAVSPPLWRALWNAGHLVFFGLLGLCVGLWLLAKGRAPSRYFWAGSVIAVLLASLLIEWLQGQWGRQASWLDVCNNLLGFCLGLAWCPRPGRVQPVLLWLRLALLLPALPAVWPIVLGAALQWQQAWQFPHLAGFETKLEVGAMRGDIALSHKHVSQGHSSVRIQLSPAPYSGVFIRRFAGDWSAYQWVLMDLYNPDAEPLRLSLRISDRQHERSQRQHYEDRFNTHLLLQPGWNLVRVPLTQVRAAPRGREMAMGQIDTLGLFATGLPQARQIYWDNLRLE